MLSVSFLALLTLSSAGAENRVTPNVRFYPHLLLTQFEVEPPGQVVDAIQEELDGIMSPIGWHFHWETLSKANEVMGTKLAIIHFKGECTVGDLTTYGGYQITLGATAISDGKIIPFADIYCNSIRALLAPDLASIKESRQVQAYGRAIGRVLAHELYHIFTEERRHGSGGLAEPQFESKELLASNFLFAPRQVQKLRLSLVPLTHGSSHSFGEQKKGSSLYVTSGCAGCHGSQGEGTRWGPSLQGPAHYDSVKLFSRLADPESPMYKSANRLNILWPRLNTSEIRQLTTFLESLPGKNELLTAGQ